MRSENSSRISVKMVSNRFTLSRIFNRFAEEMLASLALGSGRRISSTSLASATRKSSELTLWLQVAVFTRFIGEKVGRRNNATSPFSGYTMRKGRVALSRRATFEPLFHDKSLPGQVYLSVDTLRRDDAYSALPPDLSPNDFFLWVLSAIQGATPLSS